MFRLCVMTATYGRPDLTRAVLQWWSGLRVEGVEMWGVAGGDYDGDGFGFWETFPVANRPLGTKMNHTLKRCRVRRPDAVMTIGSDDIVEPSLVANGVEAIRRGAAFSCASGCVFWEPETDRFAQFNTAGSARIYSANTLDAVEWLLWDGARNGRLDASSEHTVRGAVIDGRIKWSSPEGQWPWWTVDGLVLDIKTQDNIWTFDEVLTVYPSDERPDKSILERFEIERLKYGHTAA